MPHVVNGIGTWYRGKKNETVYEGVCNACGATTQLTSYDTRLFFVILFIPIIPLAKMRVIEECAACQRHHAMPLEEWESVRKHTREKIQEYRANPTDKTLAVEAVAASQAYRERVAFPSVQPRVPGRCPVGCGATPHGGLSITYKTATGKDYSDQSL